MIVNGTPLRLLRAGKGAPLLLIRGDDASEGWRDYMEKLAESFDVIAPEHPGFGNTAKPEWLDGVADIAMFYLDVIDALNLDGVRLVGLGLGGWIASEMALRDKGRIASLALADAAGIYLADALGQDLFLLGEEDGIKAKFADPAKGAAELAYKLTPETEDTRIANQMVIAQLAWQPRWHDPAIGKWAHRIRVPTLIVWGEKDALFPIAHAHAWQKLIGGSKLEIMAGCGHVPYLENPAGFAALVTKFMQTERAAA